MSEALIVLNPREIPECIEAIEALDLPKCWVSFMYEPEAALRVNEVIAGTNYDRYVIISDDCVPRQEALDAVLAVHSPEYPVVTGYCNLDAVLDYVNLTLHSVPLPLPPPTVASYALMTKTEALKNGPLVKTRFAGLALTCMSRELWLRFPLHHTAMGGQIDYQLSYELQEAGIEIVAPSLAAVHHVKERWNLPDQAEKKRLLIGYRPKAVSWTGLPAIETVIVA